MNKPSDSQPHSPAHDFERTYRQRVGSVGLHAFQVVCQETDLMVQADRLLEQETREQVLVCRGQIDGYIQRYPDFAATLEPWQKPVFAPEIVRDMIAAGSAAGVGPMAAVAGAVAESVGRKLLDYSRHVVVENGGDIFIKANGPVVAGIFAGKSPLNMKMGIKVPRAGDGIGLCTSSGTVGHSLSAGSADAVCVVSHSCALADAAATSIGNRIRSPQDIKTAIGFGKRISGVLGIVVVAGREIGAWGQVELVPLQGKKG
ncbi:MAG: UPF0280 family protein [Desulfosarcina sp.]|nr:UPF0280 family protein [Desulfosarcina sp.]